MIKTNQTNGRISELFNNHKKIIVWGAVVLLSIFVVGYCVTQVYAQIQRQRHDQENKVADSAQQLKNLSEEVNQLKRDNQALKTSPIAISCNSVCNVDSQCQSVNSNYVCYKSTCRLATNVGDATCSQVLAATATPASSFQPTPSPIVITRYIQASPMPTPIDDLAARKAKFMINAQKFAKDATAEGVDPIGIDAGIRARYQMEFGQPLIIDQPTQPIITYPRNCTSLQNGNATYTNCY